MVMQSNDGVLKNVSTQEKLEFFPFSDFSYSAKKSDFLNEEDFFIARIVRKEKVEHIHSGRVIFLDSKTDASEWKLIHKDALLRYQIAGESFLKSKSQKNEDPESIENQNVFFISQTDFERIENDGFFVDSNDYIDIGINPKLNPQDFQNSNKQYRLIQYIPNHCDYRIIKLGKEKFIANPVYIQDHNFNSDNWDLEAVLENIIDNPNVQFFCNANGYGRNIIADKNNPEHLKKIINEVPHYNQNGAGDLEQIAAIYILTAENIQAILKNQTKNYNQRFDWVAEFSKENLSIKELNKIGFYEDEKIIATCLNAINYSFKYQSYLLEKKFSQNPQVSVSKSRFR